MERPAKIDKNILPYVEYLESKLKKFEESPVCSQYLMLLNQLEDIAGQLVLREEEVEVEMEKGGMQKVKIMKGRIDIFSSKDEKEFERAIKYFSELPKILDTLESLRKRMTPEEQKEIEKALIHKNLPLAEKIATANLNGKG